MSAGSSAILKTTSLPVDTTKLRNDRLGTLVTKLTSAYHHAPSWETFVNEFRGRSYLAKNIDDIEHPASELLRQWRDDGVPAETCSPPWTTKQKDYCIQ